MAIKGSLREASLPDVLQLLAMGQKTGCLSVTDRNNFGYIYFDRGRITYASIVNRRDRLGDTLVKAGVITQRELDAAIEAQGKQQRNKKLGEILIEQQILTREELHRYIRVQIEEAVYYLFTWTQGTFSFEADMRPDDHDVLVSINPESLLLEGARRVDEWSLIEKKVPAFDIIFELDQGRLAVSEAQLTPTQQHLIPLIDGRRDVFALIDESGIGEFEVGKALYGLATAGFIQPIGKSKPGEDVAREARVEEHRNLGVAFYRTAMFEEATREFRRVVELQEGDVQARFYLGLVAMREGRWSEAVLTLREAAVQPNARPAVFHNLAYALERMGHYEEAREALLEATQRGGEDDARIRTSLGTLALKMGEIEEADATLASARALWGKRPPSPAWFHYASLAAALAGDPERALALVSEGLEHHPHNAVLCNTLAVIQERLGDDKAAAQAAERGLREDSSLPQLHKNLGDALYRAGRYDEALEAYQRAIKLNPALGDDVYFKLGHIRFKWQEKDQALLYWERALALNPHNETVRANLELMRSLPE
ncbi:MAG: tetratricopeptide repeat protein [Gemmatimonadaceae bacterium]|nr:tetratricopeptide repeat protein [Gemmatimonadaceae bacterium]